MIRIMLWSSKNQRIYLDHASATPVSQEVFDAMKPYFMESFGNAGSIHQEGVYAAHAIDEARKELARVLRIREEGVTFTASGTESNNLAILGTVAQRRLSGLAYEDMEIISTQIEHPSVSEVLKHLEKEGVKVTYVETDKEGIIKTEAFKQALSKKTVLVTFAYVNSEIGTVQHAHKLARIVREFEKEHGTSIYVHVDAAQAPLWLSCALDTLGADLLSLDAGKCYGPKGVGVLAMRLGVSISPFLHGGDQERSLRPGTENTPLIVGASKALVLAQQGYETRSEKVTALRDYFIEEVLKIEGSVLNGSPTNRVANNVNISIPGIDAEYAVITLDQKGIAASTKSACGGAKGNGSSVIRAITQDEDRALSALRFTLGEHTTQHELDLAVNVLTEHVQFQRTAGAKLT